MRIFINRFLEWLNSDSVFVKRELRQSLGRNSLYWTRVRPFILSNAWETEHASELFEAMRNVDKLHSQFGQDAFVLAQLLFMKGGYFVDFGATDGMEGSNTYVLERKYGWRGILAEPARCWHSALQRNRTAHIELSCVAGASGREIPFYEKGVLSSMQKHISIGSKLKRVTKPYRFYSVPTISLLDLLKKYQAPKVIDYLSMDTEGSELEILSSFDFSEFRFRLITCEHNFSTNRAKIRSLLELHGYKRVFESISEADDWYISRDH